MFEDPVTNDLNRHLVALDAAEAESQYLAAKADELASSVEGIQAVRDRFNFGDVIDRLIVRIVCQPIGLDALQACHDFRATFMSAASMLATELVEAERRQAQEDAAVLEYESRLACED